MKQFLGVAPGAVWTAIVVGLMLLASWLQEYFGGVAWIPPLAAFLATVLVPVIKVLVLQDTGPVGRGVTGRASLLNRWLF